MYRSDHIAPMSKIAGDFSIEGTNGSYVWRFPPLAASSSPPPQRPLDLPQFAEADLSGAYFRASSQKTPFRPPKAVQSSVAMFRRSIGKEEEEEEEERRSSPLVSRKGTRRWQEGDTLLHESDIHGLEMGEAPQMHPVYEMEDLEGAQEDPFRNLAVPSLRDAVRGEMARRRVATEVPAARSFSAVAFQAMKRSREQADAERKVKEDENVELQGMGDEAEREEEH